MQKVYKCIDIDLTRRCNLQCLFCSRGKAMNEDISKNVIDKIFDELNGAYVFELRLSGGEPFLVPDIIQYIIDEVIRRRIAVGRVAVFTNGTIYDKCISDSLLKAEEYIKSIRKYDNEIYHILTESSVKKYDFDDEAVLLIFSTTAHENKKRLQEVYSLYNNDLNGKSIKMIIQSDRGELSYTENTVILEGLAETNLLLLHNSNRVYRRILNQYYFMEDAKGYSVVKKSIGISTNGNIFAGCLLPYNKIDILPIANILDCTENFFEIINDYCWRYPITESLNTYKEIILAIKYLKSKGIESVTTEEVSAEGLEMLNYLIDNQLEINKKLHDMYPNKSFYALNEAGTVLLMDMIVESASSNSNKMIDFYLKLCVSDNRLKQEIQMAIASKENMEDLLNKKINKLVSN